MKNNKDIKTPVYIEPMQELLIKAIISEDGMALQYCNEWLNNIDLDKVDGGSYRLIPMLYQKLVRLEGSDTENEIMGKLKGIYRYYFYKNNLIIHRLFKTLKILNEAGIRIMLLKGIALVLDYYPEDYGLRPMNDVDIFVDKEKVDETIELLAQYGWKIYPARAFHALTLINNDGYVLDLHYYLLQQCCWDNIDSSLWEHANVINFKGLPLYTLSPADQILHNCAHGVKWSVFPSIRWIIDVVTIIDAHKNSIDWHRLISESKRRSLTLTLFHALKYIESIASGRVPDWVIEELHKEPTKKSEKILFNVLTKSSGNIKMHWALHVNNNPNKSLLNNLITFPLIIKAMYGLKNCFVIPGFLISKMFHKVFGS